MPKPGTCSVPKCGRPVYAKGLCPAHYHRERRGAASDKPVRRRDPSEPVVPLSLKVRAGTKDRLQELADERGTTLYALVAEILDAWVSRRPGDS